MIFVLQQQMNIIWLYVLIPEFVCLPIDSIISHNQMQNKEIRSRK